MLEASSAQAEDVPLNKTRYLPATTSYNFLQLPGLDVIEIALDIDPLSLAHQRLFLQPLHIVPDSLFLLVVAVSWLHRPIQHLVDFGLG